MNRLSTERRSQIVRCLIEGTSIRATCRITRSDKGTVTRLMTNLGKACRAYHDEHVRNLTAKRIQIDELWAFCGMKEKNVPAEMKGKWGVGDVWTFTAIDPDSKLVPSWHVAPRDAESATSFLLDLQGRLANRVQLSSDGHSMYLKAVEDTFGADVDFAQVVKIFSSLNPNRPETRYSPGQCCGIRKTKIEGKPAKKHVSTSLVERNNLNIRMNNRRFTRLTNAFSRKVENLERSLDLHFLAYNFHKIHRTIRVTPAMEAGISDHPWEIDEIVALLDNHEWEGRK